MGILFVARPGGYEDRLEEICLKIQRKELRKLRIWYWSVWIIFWKRFLHWILYGFEIIIPWCKVAFYG